MVLSKSFEEKLKLGHDGELLIEKVLQDYGWYTIPTYDYKGEYKKSPRMIGDGKYLIVPDIDASKNRKRLWVESKLKEGASWTYSTCIFEHGLPLYLYEDYLQVEQITGCPVWLFILEANQAEITRKDLIRYANKKCKPPDRSRYPKNTLRGNRLSNLKQTRISELDNKKHIFFRQDDFFYFGVVHSTYSLLPICTYGDILVSLYILEEL